ncbi:MAG: hypothetical protein R6V62_01750 [Candidatus Fermentibacteraceae bacterium]
MRFAVLSLLSAVCALYARAPGLSGNLATARVCALRVEFIEDYTDSTTGNGKFLAEHGRDYSVDIAGQVEAYFTDVSGGRQNFDFSVYPAEGDGGYLMPHQMAWYGDNDRWPSAVIWLLVHAVLAADSEVDFSEYDAVMVVHAGAGREGDVLGNSHLDISSYYVDYSSFQYYIGLEDPWMAGGIPTNDGVLVREGVIVPEHQTQDGLGLGVLGVMVAKLLRWLGAPDLYNTSTGSVAIGGWDVMGYGQWLMYGFWPSAPGAFTREYLGWADVIEVYDGSFTVSPGDTLFRVPLSDSEYLLIENRQRDPDGNGQCGAHERDFGLPGSGILIWHIDETRLGSNLAGNTVNVDPDHQGVSVVEADGIPDFNSIYYDFFYTSEGSMWDPWMRDGYAWLLGPETTPSTSASWGGRTGVTVDVTSNSGNSMAFTVTRQDIEGWPRRVSNPASGLNVWDAPGYGELIAVLRGSGRIEALSRSGEPLFGFGAILATPPVIALIDGTEYLFTGDRNGYVHMLTPQWGDEAPGWPVRLGSEPAQVLFSERLQAAVAVAADSVHVLSPTGNPLPGWPRKFNYQVQGVCVIPDPVSPGIAVTVADGSLYAFDLAGRPLFSGVHPGGGDISIPVSSDFDRDGTQEIALTVRGYVFSYDTSGDLEPGFPAALGGKALGGLFPADLDGNGYIELVVETSTGAHAVTPSGTISADWPVTTLTDSLSEEVDRFNRGIGGSGFAGFSMRDGRTGLWNGAALEVPGTLWSLGDGPVGRPLLWKFSGDETHRLMGIASGGWIGAWPVPSAPQGWHTGLDRGGEGCWWPEDLPEKTTPELLSAQNFFVWPNPVQDGTGYIRFTPGADCSYTVRVFNVAGDLVGFFQGNAPGGSPWEVEWETSQLSPGLYYVCLQVVTDGDTSEAVFHAAVVN